MSYHNDLDRVTKQYTARAIEDVLREQEQKERVKAYKHKERIESFKFAGVLLGVPGLLGILLWVTIMLFGGNDPGHSPDHYNSDFKTFCTQLHGRTIIDDRNLCLGVDNTVLMREHDSSENDHYNQDFKRFCEIRGGDATIGIAHDTCIKNNKLIMREGKY